MEKWFRKFWWVHGERHVYGFYSFVLSLGFIYFGKKYNISEFVGAGSTILIGLAMYCFNKVRGNGKERLGDKDGNKI
jgi:hypothetical protein